MPTNCCQQKLLKYGEQTYKPWKSIDSLSLQLSYTSYVARSPNYYTKFHGYDNSTKTPIAT